MKQTTFKDFIDSIGDQLSGQPRNGLESSKLDSQITSSQFTGTTMMTHHGSSGSVYNMPSLTAEEIKERDELRIEHTKQVKNARLGEFKKLASSVRQLVLDANEWINCVNAMHQSCVDKSARLSELESRDWIGSLYGSSTPMQWQSTLLGVSSTADQPSQPFFRMFANMPEGITLDDLKQAHIEASLEEEMLNEKSTTNT